MLTEFILLLISTVLVNNFVLVQFLGLCPFMGVSGKLETAIGMSMATTFVLTLASVCSYLIETYLLAVFGLEYLRTLSFILVIAVVVQFTEMVVQKTSPTLYRFLGIFLPLITTNCAVLGRTVKHQRATHAYGVYCVWLWSCIRVFIGLNPILCYARTFSCGRRPYPI